MTFPPLVIESLLKPVVPSQREMEIARLGIKRDSAIAKHLIRASDDGFRDGYALKPPSFARKGMIQEQYMKGYGKGAYARKYGQGIYESGL